MGPTAARLVLPFLFSAHQTPNVATLKDAMVVFVLPGKVMEDLSASMTVIVHTIKSAKMQFVLEAGMLLGFPTTKLWTQ